MQRKKVFLATFSIPELGIESKAVDQLSVTPTEASYRSLIALLQFIECTPKLPEAGPFKVYGDDAVVVCQMQNSTPCPENLKALKELAESYRFPFMVDHRMGK